MRSVEEQTKENKEPELKRYGTLIEDQKKSKNPNIKKCVKERVFAKIGDNRTVKRLLELIKGKYQRTKGEKALCMMTKISIYDTKENIQVVLDDFENMMSYIKRKELVDNF